MAVTIGVVPLSLAACNGTQAASSSPTTLDSRAAWSHLALPADAVLSGPSVALDTALGSTSSLPEMVAGTSTDRDGPAHARVWTSQPSGGWRWQDLPLPVGVDGAVSAAVSDGTTTWVSGTTWKAGTTVTPFLARSTNRTQWSLVNVGSAAAQAAVSAETLVVVHGAADVLGENAQRQPVFLTADNGALKTLPMPPGGREFDGFTDAAVRGTTIVAVGSAALPGQTAEPVVYRSTDGGVSWSMTMGPVAGQASASGIAVQGDRFVVTGYTYAPDSSTLPAAWSSGDGATWTAETIPALDQRRDGLAAATRDNVWLSGPDSAGGHLVAPIGVSSALRFGVMQRDTNGTWTLLGTSNNWSRPGTGAGVAVNQDGSVLATQSSHNTGRVGVMSSQGAWSADDTVFGTDNAGIAFPPFLDPTAATPQVLGLTDTVTTDGNVWTESAHLSGYSVTGGRVIDRPWDPADSANLTAMGEATSAKGSTVLLGNQVLGQNGDADQRGSIAGWFRPSAQGAWTPVTGFATPQTVYLNNIFWLDGTWVGVGAHRATFNGTTPDEAQVWTSTDGVSWHTETGPFDARANGTSSANGACTLPGGDLLVVGSASENNESHPVLWRRTSGQWQRLPDTALGVTGSVAQCSTRNGTTLLMGSRNGRTTTWRTTDGVTFTPQTLGERGDSFGAIRVIPGGYAAAGTQGSLGHADAVVWLSADAIHWRAVPIPAQQRLSGGDVMVDGAGLVVTASGNGTPQVWSLANPGALFKTA